MTAFTHRNSNRASLANRGGLRLCVLFLCLSVVLSGLPAIADPALVEMPAGEGVCCQRDAAGNCIQTTSALTSTNSVAAEAAAAAAQVNLDLSSTAQALPAPASLDAQGVLIQVADATKTVLPGQMLTPAELVAVTQVMNGGTQSIMLSSLGAAVGGTFSLPAELASSLAALTVPQGVTAVHDFGAGAALSLSGNFSNAGSFYAVSSNPAVTTAGITAANVFNQAGGLLTSVLPDGGLMGLAGLVPALNLSLTAINSIVNSGIVSSSANLSMTAGGSIANSGTLLAAQSASLFSAAGQFANSGVVAASAGNINIASQLAQSIAVNNVAGALEALNGAINVGDALSAGAGDITINGGDLLSAAVNLHAGSGAVVVDVDDLTGALNTFGQSARVYASTETLTLGQVKLDGDPTYYNVGDIEISADIDVSEKLAILATGNISTTASVGSITAKNASGQGFDIHIIAGADLAPVCGTCSADASAGSESTAAVDVSLGNPGGGNINFLASPSLLLDAGSTGGNKDGANIVLAAFASGATGGLVQMAAGSEINVSGSGGGNNGSVLVVAGQGSGTAITLGAITAAGGTGTALGSGAVTIVTAQPSTSDAATLTFDQNGAITTGNKFVADTTTVGSAIQLNQAISARTLDVLAGGSISTAAAAVITAETVDLRSNAGTLTIGADVSGSQSVSARAGGDLSTVAAARIIASAGLVTLTSDGGNIGSGPSGRVQVEAENLVANAAAAGKSVFIGELDAVNLGAGASSAGGSFDLVAGGSITNTATTGTVSSADTVIKSVAGSITVSADIAGDESLIVSADQGITTGGGARLLSPAGLLSLASANGSIGTGPGASERVAIDAGDLVVNAGAAGQSVFIAETDTVNMGSQGGLSITSLSVLSGAGVTNTSSSGAAAEFDLIAVGDITNTASTGTVASDLLTLRSTGGAITVNADLSGTTKVSLRASGDITGSGTGRVLSPAGAIVLVSDGGNVGQDAGNRLRIDAGDLVVSASTAGKSVFLDELNAVNFGVSASQADGAFDLVAGADITTTAATGTVTAMDVKLRSTGGSLTAGANIGGTASVLLRAAGDVSTTGAARVVSGSGLVELVSDTGSTGTSASERVKVTAGTLRVSASQDAFLDEADSVTLGSAASSAGGEFNLLASGTITVAQTLSAGDLVLTTALGSDGGVSLEATVSVGDSVLIVTDDAGNVSLLSAVALNSTGGPITFVTNDMSVAGSINAGAAGVVNVRVNGAKAIGFAGAGGTLSLDADELSRITAGTLNVGTAAVGGGITIFGAYDVGGSGSGKYNLVFRNADFYTGTGHNLSLGDRTLDVGVGGAVKTGAASGAAATVLFAGDTIEIDGSINLGATASLVDLSSAGSITFTAGLLAGRDVKLTSSSGSIGGPGGGRVQTEAVNLTASAATAGNSVFISDASGLNFGSGASSAGDTFDVQAAGTITTTAGSGSITADHVVVKTTAGGLVLSAGVTGNLDIKIETHGTIETTGGPGLVSAGGSIELKSVSGSVGTGAGSRLKTETGSLAARADSSGQSVFIGNTGSLDLGASSASDKFDLVTDDDLSNTASTGTVQAGTVSLRSLSGAITVNADIEALALVDLRAEGSLDSTGTARIKSNSGAVKLKSDSGSIGTEDADRVLVAASELSAVASAAGGTVFLSELDGVNLSASSAAGQFDLVAGGSISNTAGAGSISGDSVSIRSLTGFINVQADISGTSGVSLRAGGALFASGSAKASSPSGLVTLVSDSESIGSGTSSRFAVDAGNLVAHADAAGKSAFLLAAGSVNIGPSGSSASDIFDLLANGSITSTAGTGTVTAAHVELRSLTGAVTVNANVTGSGTASVSIRAFSDIASDPQALISSPAGLVTLRSDTGHIGASATSRVFVEAATLVANAPGSGKNVFIEELDAVTLGSSTSGAGGTFDVIAGGDLTVSLSLTGSQINLRSLSGTLTVAVSLSAPTGISLRAAANVELGPLALLSSPSGTVNLTSDAGDLGSGITSRLKIDALNASANAPAGSVFIVDTNGVNLTSGSAGSGGSFDILADGPIAAAGLSFGTGATVKLVSLFNSLTLSSAVSVPGGILFLAAGRDINTASLSVSNPNGSAGTINLIAGGDVPADVHVGGAVSADGAGGDGGLIRIVTNSDNILLVGSLPDPNRVNGNITANGVNGGRIELLNRGSQGVQSGFRIEANGTSGSGGRILFALDPDSWAEAPLLPINDGLIEAANDADDSGRIAFHTGPGQNLILLGAGSLHAGEIVHFGNVDPVGLGLEAQFAGKISVQQRSILNASAGNPAPPPPEPGALTFEKGQISFLSQAQENVLDTTLASRIATDVTPQANSAQDSDQDMTFRPGGLIGHDLLTENGLISGSALDILDAGRLTGQAVQITQHGDSNYFKLSKGNVLFKPVQDIVVGTQEGDVHIPAGSAVFIIETGHDVAIYDLHDSRSGSIKIVSGKRLITLAPGRQVVLTKRLDEDFEKINPGNRIGYRKPKSVLVGEGIKAYVTDFSIPSAVAVVQPLRTMLKSETARDRKLVDKVLTNAVILSQMTASMGPYRGNAK